MGFNPNAQLIELGNIRRELKKITELLEALLAEQRKAARR